MIRAVRPVEDPMAGGDRYTPIEHVAETGSSREDTSETYKISRLLTAYLMYHL
jgi:hypothetical protein